MNYVIISGYNGTEAVRQLIFPKPFLKYHNLTKYYKNIHTAQTSEGNVLKTSILSF